METQAERTEELRKNINTQLQKGLKYACPHCSGVQNLALDDEGDEMKRNKITSDPLNQGVYVTAVSCIDEDEKKCGKFLRIIEFNDVAESFAVSAHKMEDASKLLTAAIKDAKRYAAGTLKSTNDARRGVAEKTALIEHIEIVRAEMIKILTNMFKFEKDDLEEVPGNELPSMLQREIEDAQSGIKLAGKIATAFDDITKILNIKSDDRDRESLDDYLKRVVAKVNELAANNPEIMEKITTALKIDFSQIRQAMLKADGDYEGKKATEAGLEIILREIKWLVAIINHIVWKLEVTDKSKIAEAVEALVSTRITYPVE